MWGAIMAKVYNYIAIAIGVLFITLIGVFFFQMHGYMKEIGAEREKAIEVWRATADDDGAVLKAYRACNKDGLMVKDLNNDMLSEQRTRPLSHHDCAIYAGSKSLAGVVRTAGDDVPLPPIVLLWRKIFD